MPDHRRYSPAMFAEFPITMADGTVWLSIGQALLVGGVCLAFGIWVARFVGLLESDAPAGETLAVGLASGLLVLAAWWAAIASGFTLAVRTLHRHADSAAADRRAARRFGPVRRVGPRHRRQRAAIQYGSIDPDLPPWVPPSTHTPRSSRPSANRTLEWNPDEVFLIDKTVTRLRKIITEIGSSLADSLAGEPVPPWSRI